MVGGKCNAGISIGGGQGSVGKYAAYDAWVTCSNKASVRQSQLTYSQRQGQSHPRLHVQAHNIHNCKENLKQNQQDLELVKDSITTVEVQLL